VSEPAAPARWLGLDALRGITIAAMILVNNPGDWGHVYAPLQHARWHGCTPTDLIFPAFLFVAGVAIVPALGRALARGRRPGELVPKVLRRMVVLVLLGLLLSAFPLVTFAPGKELFAPLLAVRFPGVLQRIGVCYAIAALLYLFTSQRTQRWVLVACLAAYWPLLSLAPTPDGGAPDLATPGDHFAGWLDRTVFGTHIYRKGPYDPEGLLSTIPAVATALFGVAAGRVLAGPAACEAKVAALLVRGTALAAAGSVWGWFFPINKALWTSSYAVYTAGLATAALGLCVHAFEAKSWAKWALPLRIYGQNALLVFVGSGLLARVVGRLITVPAADGKPVPLQAWFHDACLASWAEPYFASLLYALLWVGGWFLVLLVLWRRGIVWKV
jgi:predicted acyltransferase